MIENYLEGKCGLDRVQELVSRAESVNQLSAESSHLEQEIEKNQSQLDHLEGLIAKCEDQAVQLDNQVSIVYLFPFLIITFDKLDSVNETSK